VPIQNFTGRVNQKVYRIIWNGKKTNVQFVFYRDNFVSVQHCGGAGRKMYGCRRNKVSFWN